MATTQYSYPQDNTGTLATNKILAELHTVTAVNNRNYHFLIPTFAPFFADSVTLFKRNGQVLTPLVKGVDWQPAAQFHGASIACAKPIYGAISLHDVNFTGIVEIGQYQTLGGQYTLDIEKMTQVIADIVFNPRGASWEQLVNLQTMFPPVDHPWDFEDMVGQTEVVAKLTDIHDAILAGHGLSLEDHLRDYTNPHRVNKNQMDLGNVENFGPANSIQAIQGMSNETLITPMTLRAVLDALGLLNLSDLIDLFQRHIANQQNPHGTTKHHVELGQVENLPVATASDILGKKRVRKYLTLEGLIDWMALHGCQPQGDQQENFPPKDALLSAYCNNTNNIGVYADGAGGTYEKIIEVRSRDCGYVAPPSLPNHPPNGQILHKYCNGKDQYGVYANGYGGSYTNLIAINSVDCGYTGTPPPPGSSHPPAGTIISVRCEGTTQVKVIANGAGGSYDESVPNAPACQGGGVHPPADQLVDTSCVGVDLQGKYTDGSGGYYFAIAELNSSRCQTPPPPTTPTPTKQIPSINIAQSKNSLDPNQSVTFTYNVANMESAKQYRVTFKRRLPSQEENQAQDVPQGMFVVSSPGGAFSGALTHPYNDPQQSAGFWVYFAKVELISDNTVFSASNLLNLELRGATTTPPTGTPPTSTIKPNINITFDSQTLSVGQTTTLRVNVSNLSPGKTYTINYYRKHATQGSFSEFITSGTLTASNASQLVTQSVGNWGDVSNGSAQFKCTITQNDVTSNQSESNIANLNYTSNRGIRLLMDNSPGQLSIINGTMVNMRFTFTNFPISGRSNENPTIFYKLKVTGNDNREINGENIGTDSTGGAVVSFDNQMVGPAVRGLVYYQIEATWVEAGGGARSTLSNQVAVVWYSVDQPGGGNPVPVPTTPTPTTPTPTTPGPTPGPVASSCETVHVRGANLTGTASAAGTGYTGTPRYQVTGRIIPDTGSRSQLTVISTPHSEPYGRALFCTPNPTEAAIGNPVNYNTKGGMWGRWQSRDLSQNLEFFSYLLSEILAPYGLSAQFVVDPTTGRTLDAAGNFSFMAIAQAGQQNGAGA